MRELPIAETGDDGVRETIVGRIATVGYDEIVSVVGQDIIKTVRDLIPTISGGGKETVERIVGDDLADGKSGTMVHATVVVSW